MENGQHVGWSRVTWNPI